MKDIAPELLEKLQKSFREKFKNSEKIRILNKKLTEGNATYKEANEMATELGNILTEVYRENLSASILPDERMYYNIGQRVIAPTMTQNYELMSEYAKEIQTIINKSCGLGIKGVKPELNQNRIYGIVDKLDQDSFEKTKWILDEPIKNFTQSIVDDTVKANAKLHHELGLKPKIIRTEIGNCCDWCKAVAGVYDYELVKDTGNNVFRRHRFCRCTVEYAPGNNKRQNVHSKAWRDEDKSDIIEIRKSLKFKDRKDKVEVSLQEQLNFIDIKTHEKSFIPKGALVTDCKTIAEGDSIRDIKRLINRHGGRKINWKKRTGKVESDKYIHDVHWYENKGKQFETKVKHRKEK